MLVQAVLDAQLGSLKAYNVTGFAEDVQLHPITRRYGVLNTSLLLLNSDFQVAAFRAPTFVDGTDDSCI